MGYTLVGICLLYVDSRMLRDGWSVFWPRRSILVDRLGRDKGEW